MQRLFGVRESAFAFPYGYADPELTAVAKNTGVICALTAKKELIEPLTDPYDWGRLNAEQYDTASTLAAKLSGWYGIINNLLRSLWRFNQDTSAGSVAVNGNRTNTPMRHEMIHQ